MQMTPIEARKWLQDHNYIELPPGSYFHWIEADWFEKYKSVLVFRHNAWIPTQKYLKELGMMDELYKKYQRETFVPLHATTEKEVVIPQPVAEPKQEKIVNAKGEELPF